MAMYEQLAAAVDDKMIVMGSGDEIQLRFKALPAPPIGWTRDFLLLVDGWAKDRDSNTAHGQSTAPLPFHAMSRFPYPSNERFPDDQGHGTIFGSTTRDRPSALFALCVDGFLVNFREEIAGRWSSSNVNHIRMPFSRTKPT